MRKAFHSVLAAVLCVCLLAGSAAAAIDEHVLQRGTMLADNAELVCSTWSMESEDDPATLQENYVVYEPGEDVWPMVVYGDTLYGRSTMNKMANDLAAQDLAFVTAINGAFFDLNTGIPYGLVVTDAIVRSSGTSMAVGFYEDGTAVIGDPQLQITLQMDNADDKEIFYNKALTKSNGIGLYSSDYDSETRNAMAAYNIILEASSRRHTTLGMQDDLALEVISIEEDLASCKIPKNGFVLSIALDTKYPGALSQLKQLEIGDEVHIVTDCSRDWKDVIWACGGGDLLVEAGEVCEEFTLDTAEKSRARTAIGIRDDESLVFYTVDESEDSAGLTLEELAQRMAELDCQIAINLDGGGSTALGVQYPGYDRGATVNQPTDGSLRACANYIFLVREKTDTEDASKLFLYPMSQTPVLPGAKLSLTVKTTDQYYMPAESEEEIFFEAENAEVSASKVLTVDQDAEDVVTVKVSCGKMETEATYPVIDEVTRIVINDQKEKKALSNLHVPSGSKTDLSAAASYYGVSVYSHDEAFEWSVSKSIGTVDDNGVFTAAKVKEATTGILEVSFGETTAELEITVSPADPFADVKGNWAEQYINSLYFKGTITGSEGKDGKLYYRPNDSMTRQEFVVALMRFLQTDLEQYESVKLPFTDQNKIAAWAEPAVKAAYKLGYFGGEAKANKLYANPTSTISRQEAMTILARTQNLQSDADQSVLASYPDANKIASWAKDSLAAMIEKGIISGSNGKLEPLGKVTRAQVAKMLYLMQ